MLLLMRGQDVAAESCGKQSYSLVRRQSDKNGRFWIVRQRQQQNNVDKKFSAIAKAYVCCGKVYHGMYC